jgi:DNA replication protein DnaC
MKFDKFEDQEFVFDANKCVVSRTCRRGNCNDSCAIYYKTEYIYKINNMPKKYKDWVSNDLDKIMPEDVEMGINHVKRLVLDENYTKGVYLYGDVGAGKTALGMVLLNDFLRRTIDRYKIMEYVDNKFTPILFVPFSQYAEAYKGRYSNPASDLLNTINQNVYRSNLVMIDDIGFDGQTKTTIDLLFNIVDDSMSNERSLILTGNLHPQKLKDVLGLRLASRIVNGCECIEVRSSDLRGSY